MPKILFASNSISHFPGSNVAASNFDANRVPYAIECPTDTVCASPFINATSLTGETWVHLRHASSSFGANEDEPIVELVDADGNRIFRLWYQNRTTEGYHTQITGGGSNFINTRYIPNRINQARTYDVMIKEEALNIVCKVYVNELLLETIEYPKTSSINTIRQIWIGGNEIGTSFYSEIIVADGDTRNARLDLLRPVAVGAYNAWDGLVSTLSDDDPTTGMTTLTADQSQSTVLTPYSGAANISNIVQITQTVRGINSPEELQHLIRMSGVDYLSPQYALPFNKEYQITDWEQNPATSLPWSASDIASAEFGFRSKNPA